MKINKKHKIYFKDPKTRSCRQLRKASRALHIFVLQYFYDKGNDEYEELNKEAKEVKDLKPITISVPLEFEAEVQKLTGKQFKLAIYDCHFVILAELTLKLKIKKDGTDKK